jgi:Na+-driven multidrug efflux pump
VFVYVLVFGLYGFPELGVVGAAIANGLSFTVGGLIFLYLYYARRMKVAVGGRGSLSQLGFSIAGATLVGQHLGANDAEGAVKSGWKALRLAIASMVILSLVIALFAEDIARYLIDDDEVVRLTVVFIYIMALVQPLMAVEFTLGGCLRGAGDTRFPLMTTMIGLCGVRVGLAAVFVLLDFSVEWIYAALIGDYIIKAILLLRRFKGGKWQQIFSESEQRFAKS